jgi:hypothetical protein
MTHAYPPRLAHYRDISDRKSEKRRSSWIFHHAIQFFAYPAVYETLLQCWKVDRFWVTVPYSQGNDGRFRLVERAKLGRMLPVKIIAFGNMYRAKTRSESEEVSALSDGHSSRAVL